MKKELVIGLLGIFFVLGLTVFYGYQYKSKITNLKKSVSSNLSRSAVTLSSTEIQKHNSVGDCWVIISGNVYDVTLYISLHPGGASRISSFCGGDMTQAFLNQPHSSSASSLHTMMLLGPVNGQTNPQNTQNNLNNNVFPGRGEND